jgi:hypothetical protein
MGELKPLYQPLPFKVGKRTLIHKLHGKSQLTECALVIVEALFPANIL